METKPILHDWSRPQRQPWAGIGIALIKVLGHVIRFLWPLLLVRLFRTGNGEDAGERDDRVLLLMLALLLVILIASFLSLWFFQFFIDGNELKVRKGWLKKEQLSIPLERIQGVQIEESFLHRILGVVKLSVETAGSSKTEVQIEALRRPMAEALREALLQKDRISTIEETQDHAPISVANAAPSQRVLQLSDYDLIRLSATANHLETLLLILAFIWGLYDDLRPLVDRMLPGREVLAQAGLLTLLLVLVLGVVGTFIVSAFRVLLRFYGYEVWQNEKGFALRFGLFNRQQRTVGFEKIQTLHWRANWLRRALGLWLLELGAVGENELQQKQKNQVPLTHIEQLNPLAAAYHPVPATAEQPYAAIDHRFVVRRTLITGLLPVLLLLPLFWWWLGAQALLLLLWTIFVGLRAHLLHRKFRCWLFADALMLRRSLLGESFTLLKWYKVQRLELTQSPYQRQKALATLKLHTAADTVEIPWIDLTTAQKIVDYAAYETERSVRAWM